MFLKLENGMTFKFTDQGGDVQVTSDHFSNKEREQWYSKHTHINETFECACKRKALQYSELFSSAVFFIG